MEKTEMAEPEKLTEPEKSAEPTTPPYLTNPGYCPCCAQKTFFVAEGPYLRNHYKCASCGSLPRMRAIMRVLNTWFPNWKDKVVHESSPGMIGTSLRLLRECPGYIPSQYYPDEKPGSLVNNTRCENLAALTFDDESVDLHVTQDVMEHLFDPHAAFREIARTLRPGGAHVFTVPLVRKFQPSQRRAELDSGRVTNWQEPQFHGNPISKKGSLVTMDWGYDICRHIFESSGLYTHIVHIDDLSRGIRAELNEVLVTVKPVSSQPSQRPAVPL